MGKKYPQHTAGKDGWTEWISPSRKLYKMACYDCGLVHGLQFKLIDYTNGKKILMRVRRENRATGQMRKKYKSKKEK